MEVEESEGRIDEIEFARHPDKAERLFALAHEVPVGFPLRASALIASGEHYRYGGRFAEARQCCAEQGDPREVRAAAQQRVRLSSRPLLRCGGGT